MHDPNKEDAVDYSLFITCKKFISKVKALGKVHNKPQNIFIGYLGVLGLDSRSKLLILHSYKKASWQLQYDKYDDELQSLYNTF